MNRLLLVFVLVAGSLGSYGQCVIYASDQTGAFGAGYNNDNQPTTWQECTDYAIKKCKESGAKDCTFLYKSSKTGWFGLITGEQASTGRIFFQGGDGYGSKSEAENAVREKYRKEGGKNPYSVQVYTWYAYSNVKN